ncbi:MAG: formyltransferase family protein, partial [Parvularculaceae bacterium]
MALDRPLKAVVVGAVESTTATLEALRDHPHWRASALVTLPLSLAKRHSDFVDLRPVATDAGAAVIEAKDSNDPAVLDAVRAVGADWAFVVGWSQICKPEFRALFDDRVVGYNPAPLPMLRGRAVIPWTILLDVKITGSSLFYLGDGVDDGDLIAQKFFHVASDEPATPLYDRHIAALRELLADALDEIADAAAAGRQPRRADQNPRNRNWKAKR